MSRSLPITSVLATSGVVLLVAAGFRATAQNPKPTPPPPGQKIYLAQCAGCHGDKGQGGAGYARPLRGTRSVKELAQYIHTQMPPGAKKTPAPQANLVAAYVHDAFYSPVAQDRNRPARVELARLTVKQFRNAVADLVGDFRPVVPAGDARGLTGSYFKGNNFQGGKEMDRNDGTVDFDFGPNPPVPGKIDPLNFSMIWQGSVMAPDTGDYEFVVRSNHAIRLSVNGEKPILDAWVKSGNDTEFKASIHLLGGRAYPIRLEFSKGTQGVDDKDKRKGTPSPPAFVSLLWKRPGRVAEVIPNRNLFPQVVPVTFVAEAPFPADDRSIGYERGNTVSKEWDDATTAAALETAGYIANNLNQISGVPENAPDRKEKLRARCRSFVERAFRRPLTPAQEERFVNRQFAVAPNVEIAVKRVVILTLKSPQFLYRELKPGSPDSYFNAAQLSFGLWDSLPDPELQRAAAAGQLVTREQVAAQADRMANDPRSWNKLRDFLLLWLKVDEIKDIVKNAKRYPEMDAAAGSDLRTTLEIFLEKTAWSNESSYRDLMLSPTQYLNGRLAKVYGQNLPADAPFQPVQMDPGQRMGVLGNPYLLSRFAYLENSSPIHRGVLIIRSMLGRTLLPPPAAFTPLSPSLHPNLTTRERVSLQTKPAACSGCHNQINPLGFTLEKFDAIGRLRTSENGKSVDATGKYISKSGAAVKFSGAPALAEYLADSEEAHAAITEKLFQHLVKQPVLAYGPNMLPQLENSFRQNRYSLRKLMGEVMVATVLADMNKSTKKAVSPGAAQ